MDNVVYLPTRSVQITLSIDDPAILRELEKREDGPSREAFALQALRLGVLALRQVSTAPDADVIRLESVRLLVHVGSVLQQRTAALSNAIVAYLDPASGSLPQRIEQLSQPGGDLATALDLTREDEHSAGAHVVEQGSTGTRLSMKQREDLLATLSATLKKALAEQREEVLKQFSLARPQSALSCLLADVTNAHGELSEDANQIASEFSIDNHEGALFRLVSGVERAQAPITQQFSLEHAGSALCRLASLLDGATERLSRSC